MDAVPFRRIVTRACRRERSYWRCVEFYCDATETFIHALRPYYYVNILALDIKNLPPVSATKLFRWAEMAERITYGCRGQRAGLGRLACHYPSGHVTVAAAASAPPWRRLTYRPTSLYYLGLFRENNFPLPNDP